jgi:hypothetical protein
MLIGTRPYALLVLTIENLEWTVAALVAVVVCHVAVLCSSSYCCNFTWILVELMAGEVGLRDYLRTGTSIALLPVEQLDHTECTINSTGGNSTSDSNDESRNQG